MNYAIILAGGSGTRFWPLSRKAKPKQFLKVSSGKPLIEETILRITPLIKRENIYIATSRLYEQRIKELAKRLNIPHGNILFEPESKNTFWPIAVLSKSINKIDSEAHLAVLPSDHFIKDRACFLGLLRRAFKAAERGSIVTLGVPPKSPETGYGYIKIKSQSHKVPAVGGSAFGGTRPPVYKVEKFIEKPDLKTAKRFIKDKRYYWNAGIFVFKAQVILGEIKKLMPSIYKGLAQVKNKKDLKILFRKAHSISIDYAVMEETDKMALLPADCGWTDLGSWEALIGILKKDNNGNIFKGRHIDMGSKNTLVWPDNRRLITTLGLNNIIIVDTQDSLLVCRRDMSQDVKKAVNLLRQKGYKGKI